MSSNSQINRAAALLLQTPPGQTAKVYHDIRALLEYAEVKDLPAQLKAAAASVLEQYNVEQLITVKPQAPAAGAGEGATAKSDGPIIISRAAEVPGQAGRYADPNAKLSYVFDHLRLAASDPKPLAVNSTFEKTRSAIDEKVSKYVQDHFQDGVTSTCTVIKPDPAQAARIAAADPSSSAEPIDEAKAEEKRKEAEESAHDTPSMPTGAEGTAEAEGKGEDTAEVEGAADKEPAEAAGEAAEAVEDDPVEAVKAAEEVEQASTKDADADAGSEVADAKTEQAEPEEPQGEPTYVTHIVGNRYNLNNFWAGRWRSSYTYTPSASGPASLTSSIQLQVHYFEDGNVQLAASRPLDIPLDLADGADEEAVGKAIALAIKKHESAYHAQLNEAYSELSEKAFKAIRRQLPVTKQKLDWDKAINYKIASQLNK